MDGMSVLHNFREDPWGKNALVIILTNLDTNDKSLNDVINNYPSFYLIKVNTTLEVLLEKIEEVLENKE